MEPIILETERLVLRTLHTDEAAKRLTFYLENLEHFGEFGPKYPEEVKTLDYHLKETEREYLSAFTKRQLGFYFYLKEDEGFERMIGNLNFSNITHGHFLSCTIGYKMVADQQGKGYMTEAIKAGIDYYFNVMKMHRVEANIIPRNLASLSVIKKLGFVYEGYSPCYLKMNDVWEDHERWTLLNDDLDGSG
jgi:ribosomal-protein-alanine N-acetyltransferase